MREVKGTSVCAHLTTSVNTSAVATVNAPKKGMVHRRGRQQGKRTFRREGSRKQRDEFLPLPQTQHERSDGSHKRKDKIERR